MPDPNSLPINIAVGNFTIPAPVDPRGIAFLRILELELTASAVTVVTITSQGTTFPTRTLDVKQLNTGNSSELPDGTGPGFGGHYDCDPGGSFQINNSAGNLSGHVRYTVIGAG